MAETPFVLCMDRRYAHAVGPLFPYMCRAGSAVPWYNKLTLRDACCVQYIRGGPLCILTLGVCPRLLLCSELFLRAI
jgi:hypothetical protein